jgi:hypothetical protein
MGDELPDIRSVEAVIRRLQPGEHLYFDEPDGQPFLARFTPQQKKAAEVLYLNDASVGQVLDFLDTQLAQGPYCSSWTLPALKS